VKRRVDIYRIKCVVSSRHRLDPGYDKDTYETLTMKVTGLAALLFALTAGI
jgi:hypothetical protein